MARIRGETLERLQTALFETLKAHNLHPGMVRDERDAWCVFHQAWKEGRLDGNALYREFNDAHLTTAFKRIFKQVRG